MYGIYSISVSESENPYITGILKGGRVDVLPDPEKSVPFRIKRNGPVYSFLYLHISVRECKKHGNFC